jgi:hypothetical protein
MAKLANIALRCGNVHILYFGSIARNLVIQIQGGNMTEPIFQVERHGVSAWEIKDFDNQRKESLCLRCKNVKGCLSIKEILRNTRYDGVETIVVRCPLFFLG